MANICFQIISTDLVRFDQNAFMEYLARYIHDANGNLRDIIKTATSITISSDQGKGNRLSKIFLYVYQLP